MAKNGPRQSARITKRVKDVKVARYTWQDVSRRSLRVVIRESIKDARLHSQVLLGRDTPSPPSATPTNTTLRRRKQFPLPLNLTSPSSTKMPASPTTPDFSRGIPSPRKGWYYIKAIVDEIRRPGRIRYLVEWAGTDPKTGMPWPIEWVDAKDVSATAVKIWEQKKAAESP